MDTNSQINCFVYLQGCKPPWYLSWFDQWKDLLNEGVTEAFQEFADNYEHQSEIPEEFSPFKNVFVHYFITNLIWTKEHVVFEAWATFSVLVAGKNETFSPEYPEWKRRIPLEGWNTTSPDDVDSHLLQGNISYPSSLQRSCYFNKTNLYLDTFVTNKFY